MRGKNNEDWEKAGRKRGGMKVARKQEERNDEQGMGGGKGRERGGKVRCC